jgi:hypothetical protein
MIEMFGATPEVIARAWYLIEEGFDIMPRGATKERFLWGLLLLKSYGTTKNMASRCGCNKDTFRKWAWFFLEELSFLEDMVVCPSIISSSFVFCFPHLLVVFLN